MPSRPSVAATIRSASASRASATISRWTTRVRNATWTRRPCARAWPAESSSSSAAHFLTASETSPARAIGNVCPGTTWTSTSSEPAPRARRYAGAQARSAGTEKSVGTRIRRKRADGLTAVSPRLDSASF